MFAILQINIEELASFGIIGVWLNKSKGFI
jgi:hypothetical protein